MGNHPSAHQPLERATSYGNGLRLSKRERSPGKRMDRLRRSFRDSFRRRKDPHVPESSKPHQWQADESAVRSATCAFHVKYLGCVEVFESRGMQVCEEALKVLRNSRRRPVRAVLHVSGDGLRVVEDETKGLIVDQTIEKVSFCAPDRNHEKGFSYICRDGTTRRWMCHGFLALKESGERLSHAVGCAFAACLERKQRRDKECGVTMTFDSKTSTFTRSGSFRQPSLTERLQDSRERAVDVPPVKQVYNPFAIERPHATPSMLERQGSFRGFTQLNQASPFKRQLSLRVNDLPSNLERTRSHSLEPTDLSRMPPTLPHIVPLKPPVSPIPEISPSGQDSVSAMCQQLSRGLSLLSSSDDFGPMPSQSGATTVAKKLFISSSPPVTVSSSLDDMKKLHNGSVFTNNNNNNNSNGSCSGNNNNINNDDNNSMSLSTATADEDDEDRLPSAAATTTVPWQDLATNPRLTPILNRSCNLSPVLPRSSVPTPIVMSTPASSVIINTTNNVVVAFGSASPAFSTASTSSLGSIGVVPVPVPAPASVPALPISLNPPRTGPSPNATATSVSPAPSGSRDDASVVQETQISVNCSNPPVQAVTTSTALPKPEQWLGTVTGSVPISSSTSSRRAPPLHARALSLGSAAMNQQFHHSRMNNVGVTSGGAGAGTGAGGAGGGGGSSDPFDAEWAEIAARNLRQAAVAAAAAAQNNVASTTNPFVMPTSATQAFQVQL